ncbi:replicative DNA helicase [Brucella sp. 191011898]|nr:replicative DNA helicase [Brucella sp. 191011898]
MVSDDILAHVRRGPRRKSQLSIKDAADNAFAAAKEAQERGSGLTGLTWGLRDVNSKTGGIHKRDLTLIGGRPSMGKTTVGLSTCLKVASAGHGVGFISLEMDADKLAARAVTDIAFNWDIRVPYQNVITGRATIEELEELQAASKRFEGLPLLIEEQSGLSITDIRIKLETMMQKMEQAGNPLEMLMIDHLGLIRASNRYSGNRTNEIAEMTSALKSMAREYGIANKTQVKVWRARNMIMLEAVIAAFMDTDSPEEVATVLRAQADRQSGHESSDGRYCHRERSAGGAGFARGTWLVSAGCEARYR